MWWFSAVAVVVVVLLLLSVVVVIIVDMQIVLSSASSPPFSPSFDFRGCLFSSAVGTVVLFRGEGGSQAQLTHQWK